MIGRRRRLARVVLWGGRPGVDRQFGSRADRVYETWRERLALLQPAVGPLHEMFRRGAEQRLRGEPVRMIVVKPRRVRWPR